MFFQPGQGLLIADVFSSSPQDPQSLARPWAQDRIRLVWIFELKSWRLWIPTIKLAWDPDHSTLRIQVMTALGCTAEHVTYKTYVLGPLWRWALTYFLTPLKPQIYIIGMSPQIGPMVHSTQARAVTASVYYAVLAFCPALLKHFRI